MNTIKNMLKKRPTEDIAFEKTGFELKKQIDKIFSRSLAIRALDCGSDNSTELELNNLSSPHYDIGRFGISFVASPRHADILLVTGAVTLNMVDAAKKTFDAMPSPKFVVAVGDDACGTGIFAGSYAVLGGAEKIFKVDLKIPGNPPTPNEILKGILTLMYAIRNQKSNTYLK